MVHECFSGNPIQQIEKKASTLTLFNEGITHYLNKSFAEAHTAFDKVMQTDTEDRTARFFFHHTQQILEAGSHESKAGVMEMKEK